MLPAVLRAGLDQFVEQLLTGELPRSKDYGLMHFVSQLYSNYEEQTPEVVAYMAERVLAATNGKQSIVLADRKYFARTYASGMTMALVPTGEDAASPNARLFEFSGASNGNCFAERASDESIAEFESQIAASEKRQHRRLQANGLLEKLHQDLHRQTSLRLRVWLSSCDYRQLSSDKRASVADVFGLAKAGINEVETALHTASLPQLCEVLIILEKEDIARL